MVPTQCTPGNVPATWRFQMSGGTQEGWTLSETTRIAAVTVVCQEGQQGRREGTISGMSAHVSQARVPAVGMWEAE